MSGLSLSEWLAKYIRQVGRTAVGAYGYSPFGAVVGATFPQKASQLRGRMPDSYFLVPGFGAQGGTAADVVPCFNDDGLGALVSSSRGILYSYQEVAHYDGTRHGYQEIVRKQAAQMREQVTQALRQTYREMVY